MDLSQPWIVDCEEIDDPLDLELFETDKLESPEKEDKAKEKVKPKKLPTTTNKGVKKHRIFKKSTCPICGKQFGGQGYLKLHLENVHKSEWVTEKVDNFVQLDHNYCANNNNPSKQCHSSKAHNHSNKKGLKSGNTKGRPKKVIPAGRKDRLVGQKRCDKKRTTPEHADNFTNQVDVEEGLKHYNTKASIPEHVGEPAEKVNDVIEEQLCVICPKVSELNELVQIVFTKQDLVEMEPYHCVACSKRFTWDLTDVDSIDFEDLISTNMLEPNVDPESRIKTEIVSFMDTDLTENNTESPVSNECTSTLPVMKRRRNKLEKFECQFCQRKFNL